MHLEADLAKGPPEHDWEDKRWMLARTKTLIGGRFHLACTIEGVRKLLVRDGWSCQVPARRTMERDDDAWPGGARTRRCSGRRAATSDPTAASIERRHSVIRTAHGRQPGQTTRTRSRGRGANHDFYAALDMPFATLVGQISAAYQA